MNDVLPQNFVGSGERRSNYAAAQQERKLTCWISCIMPYVSDPICEQASNEEDESDGALTKGKMPLGLVHRSQFKHLLTKCRRTADECQRFHTCLYFADFSAMIAVILQVRGFRVQLRRNSPSIYHTSIVIVIRRIFQVARLGSR